jgi:hypothetical protein
MNKIIAFIYIGFLTTPVVDFKTAEKRYGKLSKDYSWKNRTKWLVKFDPSIYGRTFKTPMWVNKDIALPLSLVFGELKRKGLLKEISFTQGCYAARAIRGTNRPSIHAYGLGCDFNNKEYSEAFIAVWKSYGWTWGGSWCGKYYDPMHFSWAGWERNGKCVNGKMLTAKK